MIPTARRQSIIDILNRRGYITVEELAQELYVSLSTIRRDLTILEKEGAVRRSYGGVSYVNSQFSLEPTEFRSRKNREEKRKIARIASTLICEGDTVFLDSGSTCLSLTYELSDISDLLILTNGLINVRSLSRYDNIQIDVPGGIYDTTHACIVGEEAADYIARRQAQVAFVSCSGIDAFHGNSVVYQKDISVKKAYSLHSEKTILLMDSSKFGVKKYYKVYGFDEIDILICDKEPPKDIMDICQEKKVEVIFE